MGRTLESFTISASISNHNSEQDEIDERLWKDLRKQIRKIMDRKKYRSISPMEC